MVVSAGVHIIELAGLVMLLLGVFSLEDKALDFVGGVERVALGCAQFSSKSLQNTANVGGVGLSILVDDIAKHQHFAGTEYVGRSPIEGAPVDAETQIAFALRGETT